MAHSPERRHRVLVASVGDSFQQSKARSSLETKRQIAHRSSSCLMPMRSHEPVRLPLITATDVLRNTILLSVYSFPLAHMS